MSPRSDRAAVAIVAAAGAGAFLAGGTTEIDLIRAGLARADLLVDVERLTRAG